MILQTLAKDVWFITGKTPKFIRKELENSYNRAITNPGSMRDVKKNLAGNLDKSYKVLPSEEFTKFITSAIQKFLPEINKHSTKLKYTNSIGADEHWMNIQKKGDYNPIHAHSGQYSYVFWHKVPFLFEEENKVNKLKNSSFKRDLGDFTFTYIDIENLYTKTKEPHHPQSTVQYINTTSLGVDKTKENTFCIFPSWLPHSVDPFYSTDGDRVTFSGNYEQISNYNKKEKLTVI